MKDPGMMDCRPVTIDVHHEIEQFYYREARMLDSEMLREWLTTMVDPGIRYQMVIRDERFRKDKSPDEAREFMPFDDDYDILDMRIRQFETGLQYMLDPPQKMFRVIGNVEAFLDDENGGFTVLSSGTASRFRRLYENERTVYRRRDHLQRGDEGKLRLVSRNIELGERVITNKNLLFFL